MKLEIVSLAIPTHKEKRIIRILLPEDYDQSNKSYRVLYMHDGQNLFEDETAFNHQSWKISECLKLEHVDDLIVVGIDNSDYRLFEYSPWPCSDSVKKKMKISIGGLGEIYASWIINQVKPYIDKNYRTKSGFNDTMMAGSSMGAYITIFIASTYPNTFKTLGIFSLASWFNEDALLNHMRKQPVNTQQTYFISVGRHESSDPNDPDFNEIYLNNSRKMRDTLKEFGVKNIMYVETDDVHNEIAWRKVFPKFLSFAYQKSTSD